jgi:hypothetical protein
MGEIRRSSSSLEEEYNEGKEFITNEGYTIIIENYINYDNVFIYFKDFPDVKRKVKISQITKGNIRNPYFPSVYGIGYIGEGPYTTSKYIDDNQTIRNRAYDTWNHMMGRCYSRYYLDENPTYEQCFVDPIWHNFQNFAKWYYDWYYELPSEKVCLDKDLFNKDPFIKSLFNLQEGQKVYSMWSCCFLPESINSIITISTRSVYNDLPLGVTFHKAAEKYTSNIKLF